MVGSVQGPKIILLQEMKLLSAITNNKHILKGYMSEAYISLKFYFKKINKNSSKSRNYEKI